METVVVGDIHADHLYRDIGLPMWVLYDHPTDLPDHFVLRLWDGMTNTPTAFVFMADHMGGVVNEVARVPGRFYRMDRFENDDPKIMGVFL